jgi:Acetyltransferase (GNAT) domain
LILIERAIARVLRYRKVFFASEDQLADLTKDLQARDFLRSFSPASILSTDVRLVYQRKQKTAFVDLTKNEAAIFADMHASCRYKIRRAEKLGGRIKIGVNTDAVRQDFMILNDAFVRNKRVVRPLKPHRLAEYLPHCDIFVLYYDGIPACGRLVLRDEETRTALMMFSPTRRFFPGADTITIGLVNRYLHWYEMKNYRALGLEKYDFGGLGPASLAQFKMSFGAQPASFNYCVYSGAARLVWKFAHSLYELRHAVKRARS